MARSQNSFMKKQLQKEKQKKREDKEQRKVKRQESSVGGNLDDMIAYVDEFGAITSVPPDERNKAAKSDKKEIA